MKARLDPLSAGKAAKTCSARSQILRRDPRSLSWLRPARDSALLGIGIAGGRSPKWAPRKSVSRLLAPRTHLPLPAARLSPAGTTKSSSSTHHCRKASGRVSARTSPMLDLSPLNRSAVSSLLHRAAVLRPWLRLPDSPESPNQSQIFVSVKDLSRRRVSLLETVRFRR